MTDPTPDAPADPPPDDAPDDAAPPIDAPVDPDERPVFARELSPLHPKIRVAWLVEEFIGALVFSGIAAGVDFLWLSPHVDAWPLPTGALFAGVAVPMLLWTVVGPRLTYRFWRYAIREHDVLTSSGIVWRTQRSVPRLRIQHVELQTGPITRRLGLVAITFYTAGSGAADAKIPGLEPEVAEAIRDRLLEHDLPELAAREADDDGDDDETTDDGAAPAPRRRRRGDVEGQLMLFPRAPAPDAQ